MGAGVWPGQPQFDWGRGGGVGVGGSHVVLMRLIEEHDGVVFFTATHVDALSPFLLSRVAMHLVFKVWSLL